MKQCFLAPPIFLTLGRAHRKVQNQLSARDDIMFTAVRNPGFLHQGLQALTQLF